jgi:hypothetical protein
VTARRAPVTVTCAVAIAASLSACKPTISSFRAEPNVICRGGTTRLNWEASNDGRILSSAAAGHDGQVGASGSRVVAPAERTRYRLYAINAWGHDQRDVDVDVVTAPAEAMSIGGSMADPSMQCDGANVSVAFVAPPQAWDSHIRASVVAVGAHVNRRYHVQHGGVAADLAPGVPSAAFADLAVRGAWNVSTPLGPGESCQKLPHSVVLDVTSACSP